MNRMITLALCLIPLTAACATVEGRTDRFSHLSCAQLATALEYEQRGERSARRTGVIAGVASIFESGGDEDALSVDSDFNFLEADDRRISVQAIKLEQARRCDAPA